MKLDISQYKPGRFEYLMKEPFASELWEFLADEVQIEKMLRATKEELPAIEYFLEELEERFEEHLKSGQHPEEEVATLANNMIRQIMEHHGYTYSACGFCFSANYIKMSGVYSFAPVES